MRVSTSFSFEMNTASMQSQQADIFHTQQQVATRRRIVTPSDDPVGSTHVLENARSLAVSQNNTQSMAIAGVQLQVESTTLDAIRQVVSNARNIAIGGTGNPSAQETTSFINFLQQSYQDLLGYANSKDSQENYIFSGFSSNTVPFQQATGPANYQGDNGQRNVAISSSRQIPVSDSGQAVFGVGTPNDPFDVISTFITALTDLQNGTITQQQYGVAATAAVTGLSNALDNVVNIQDQVSLRIQELKAAQNVEAQFSAQFQSEIDRVESVDMQKAAVTLNLQQVSLEATQKAFLSASKLTLFEYL